ncbi:TetR family transcriptional regulator [Novosphingobium pokkalii]|uniref:TetR family transcriptional regulator n=1 Tax=Novosphingobium pokkalii TaxID=1770194 RepID=UPI003638071F
MGTRALRTREHLLNTARQTFLKQGYDATSIDSIAEAAGSRARLSIPISRRRASCCAKWAVRASRPASRS